jgi:polyhydroxyalkanoate synthesis regulator phasin
MADPANERGPLETLGLAGLGALTLVAERADDLADEIAGRLGVERDDVRTAVGDVLDSWRREAGRLGEHASDAASRVAEELGVASRETLDELALRVAQLEHRLKLLERSR